jgi:hypothetical protein
MRRQGKKRGYTFIEILLSLIIFTMTVGLVSYAITQSLDQYKGVIHKTTGFWQKTKMFWLQKSFSSTIDYYVREEEWFPFFEGERDYIAYITEVAFAFDKPVLAVITLEKNSIVYYEIPVYTLTYTEIKQILREGGFRKGTRVILFENVESPYFEYYGWQPAKERPSWDSIYSGQKNKLLPMYVKISFKKDNNRLFYLFPIRNNSTLKEIYNEIYQ